MLMNRSKSSGKVFENSSNFKSREKSHPNDSNKNTRHSFANEFIQISCQLHWLLSGPDQPSSGKTMRTEMHFNHPKNTTTVLRTHTYLWRWWLEAQESTYAWFFSTLHIYTMLTLDRGNFMLLLLCFFVNLAGYFDRGIERETWFSRIEGWER